MNIITGFDDGFFLPCFKGRKGRTLLVGISVDEDYPFEIKTLTYNYVLIDGRETTRSIIRQLKYHGKPKLLLLDGITYAGFDVVDPMVIYYETGIPVVVIQQYPLDLKRIKKALSKNFNDWIDRFRIIEKIVSKYVYLQTRWKVIQYYSLGLKREEIENILRKIMLYSPIPEPLRLAHIIASNISRKLYRRGQI